MVRDDSEEGVGVVVPARHWWLPQPEKLGGQLPAGSGEPLPWHHDGGEAYQELVVGLELELKLKVFGDKEDSSCSLAVDLLPLVEKVRVALTPATSNSS